jgi:hypothetical protein
VNLTSLFSDPQSEPAKQLAQLGARRRELLAKQRDALTALDAVKAEHNRLARDLEDREARSLALGQDAPRKSDRDNVAKAARKVDEHDNAVAQIARAVELIDEEAQRTVTANALTLFSEANELHQAAHARVAELTAELHAQQAALRDAFAIAQRVLTAGGHHRALRSLRGDEQASELMTPADLDLFIDEVNGGNPRPKLVGNATWRREDLVARLVKLRRKHARSAEENTELDAITARLNIA